MRVRDLALWTLVAVALVVGALPLQVCMPHDGEPATVQVAGCHGHDHEDGIPDRSHRDGSCCDDVPLDRSTPGTAVAVPALAPVARAALLATSVDVAALPVRVATSAAPPRDRGLIVLLR